MTVTMPVWTLVAALLATAGAGGWGTHLVHRRRRFDRWLTAQEQQAQKERGRWWATLDATLATVAPVPAADPEPARVEAMVCAGTDLPPRDTGLAPVNNPYRTAVLDAIDAAYDVEPTPADEDLPRDEARVTSLGRRDDDTGGTPVVGAVAVDSTGQFRHDWPIWNGHVPAPARTPWRAPIPGIRVRRLYSPVRVLWAALGRDMRWLATLGAVHTGQVVAAAGRVARAVTPHRRMQPAGWEPGEVAGITGMALEFGLPSARLAAGAGVHRKRRIRRECGGRHRPETVARRTLRPDWRAILTARTRRSMVPTMPGAGCTP